MTLVMGGTSAATAHPRRLVVNGRFLSQRVTGVQRYARELVRALDARLAARAAAGDPWPAEIHAPPGSEPLPGLRHMVVRTVGRRSGHAWEQLDLPRSAAGAILLNLGNTGPLLHPRQLLCIHDAGVYTVPESYSPAFRGWYRLLWAVLGRRALRVLTVSGFSAGELGRHVGIPADRLAVVPNAADHVAALDPAPDALHRLGLEPGGYVFALGSRAKAKNLAGLAAAMALLPDPKPPLVTAGGRNERIFADAGGLAGVRELGPVDDATLKSLYQGAICLVFPSFYEGFGLPPLEAMIAGCPVVASRAASMPEVCGDAALYVDPHDPADIAAAIARLVGDPTLRADFVDRGRRRATRFGWDISAERLLAVLDAVEPRGAARTA